MDLAAERGLDQRAGGQQPGIVILLVRHAGQAADDDAGRHDRPGHPFEPNFVGSGLQLDGPGLGNQRIAAEPFAAHRIGLGPVTVPIDGHCHRIGRRRYHQLLRRCGKGEARQHHCGEGAHQ